MLKALGFEAVVSRLLLVQGYRLRIQDPESRVLYGSCALPSSRCPLLRTAAAKDTVAGYGRYPEPSHLVY